MRGWTPRAGCPVDGALSVPTYPLYHTSPHCVKPHPTRASVGDTGNCPPVRCYCMTQKENVIAELIREPRGLTAIELRERVGVPEHSLRTILWEMRKEGWIDVVGGVRGRYRYAATEEGRKQAPSPRVDVIAELLTGQGVTTQGRARDPVAIGQYVDEHRRLTDFAHWLLLEKPELFATSLPKARDALEKAVAAYVEKDMDVLRRFIEAALQRPDK